MKLIDTHSHIYSTEFNSDQQAILDRSNTEGVATILMPAIDSSTHEAMLNITKIHPAQCLSMMGLHPCSVKENYKDELRIAREYLDNNSMIAIGETGLDFYWDLTFTDQQYDAFNEQARWALEFDVPLVIHSRNSTDECINVVQDHQQGKLKGVFHCFSGTVDQAKKIIDLGFYLGIGGVLTFKNSGLDKVIAEVGMEKVVLETDAPYLAPVPFRGKRNEPAYLSYIVNKLSEVMGMDVNEVADRTTSNATVLFNLK
jgi:TatD DNase family protein